MTRRSLIILPPLLLLAACADFPTDTTSFIFPMDGQTGIAPNAELQVRAPSMAIPPDYPMPEVLRVVDLADGGFVAGTFKRDGDDYFFRPDAPWASNRRYVWTLDVPDAVAHGPEFEVPESLLGSAVFDTSQSVDVLAAATDEGGQVCLVLSRTLTSRVLPVIEVTADDVPLTDISLIRLDRELWEPTEILPLLAPDADVVCLVTEELLVEGTRLRVWLDEEGPWIADVRQAAPMDVIIELHRGSL